MFVFQLHAPKPLRSPFSFNSHLRAQTTTSPLHVRSTRDACNSLMIRSSNRCSAFWVASLLHWHTTFADCELDEDQCVGGGKRGKVQIERHIERFGCCLQASQKQVIRPVERPSQSIYDQAVYSGADHEK